MYEQSYIHFVFNGGLKSFEGETPDSMTHRCLFFAFLSC